MAASLVDFMSLPDVVTEKIASFLHGRDLINLGYTCKYWSRIAGFNHVWKDLVVGRFGKQALGTLAEDDSNNDTDTDYKQLYMKLASARKPATDFCVCHLFNRPGHGGEYYLEKVRDPESICGEVVKLNTVCWLQINADYKGVIPGKYKLIWRMRLDDAYLSCNHVEFRARPEEYCGSEVCKIWKDEDFKEAERKFGSGKWFEADMGEFLVTSLCNVYVEIKGRIDWWCGGISWDFAELRPSHLKAAAANTTGIIKSKTNASHGQRNEDKCSIS